MNRFIFNKKYPFLSKLLIRIVNFFRKLWFFIIFRNKNIYYKYQLSRPLGPRNTICYAPFTSLFFGTNGSIVACCLNRNVVFGKHPENSISQALNSDNIKKLRKYLKNNNLDYGCFHCKQRIESNSFDSVEAKLYDSLPLSKSKMPTYFIFELSNTCNLNCIMCSPEFSSSFKANEQNQSNYKSPYGKEFVEELREYIPHLVKAKFMGGEPFLINIYYDIWELIIETNPNCIIDIQTNGTVLNDKIKSLLERGNFKVSVSFDSFEKETYEQIRQNANFESVISNIEYFKNYSQQKNYIFSISICPMQQNMYEIPDIFRKCNNLNAHVYCNTVWKPASSSLYFLDTAKLSSLMDFYASQQLPTNTLSEKHNYSTFQSLINQLRTWRDEKQLKEFKQQFPNVAYWDEMKSKVNEKSLSEIKNMLFDYISEFADKAKIELYKSKIDKIIELFDDKETVKLTLFNLINYPAELLTQELDNEDINELYNKAVEAFGFIKNEYEQIEHLKQTHIFSNKQ